MNDGNRNVLVAAVGGQGAVLAARVLGLHAQSRGLDVKVSEIHGMSQRGGSVVTHVRFGTEVYSPVIEKGAADTILAFEQLEGLRYVDYLRPGGMIIVNQQQILPLPVLTGAATYPSDFTREFARTGVETIQVDAFGLAQRAGSEKAVNVVLLGAYAGRHADDRASWQAALESAVPRKSLKANLAAFELGYALGALHRTVTDQQP